MIQVALSKGNLANKRPWFHFAPGTGLTIRAATTPASAVVVAREHTGETPTEGAGQTGLACPGLPLYSRRLAAAFSSAMARTRLRTTNQPMTRIGMRMKAEPRV